MGTRKQPTLETLIGDPRRVNEVDTEVIPGLIIRLSALQCALAAQITTTSSPADNNGGPNPDRLLTAKEVADMLNRHPSYIYRNAKRFPFVVREGHGLRFSLAGLQRFIQKQRR